jgi:hypothetical protein
MSDQTNIYISKVRTELVNYVRSKDILTTTQRGVVTRTVTGNVNATSLTLPNTNMKNVRSIVIDGTTTLKYGRDYDIANAGVINFTSTVSGAYSISYDYGNQDKIYPDLPRDLATITDFPRVGIEWLGSNTQPGGFGSVDVSDIDMTIVVYGPGTDYCENALNTLRAAIRTDKSNFWYMGSWTQILSTGPFILEDRNIGKDKLVHQNLDIRGRMRYEK